MISIIIPVYKVELYIRNCLNSVLNQTYKDYEVILIDDGSPDACGKICEEYAENRSNWNVVHQKNAGQAAARNAGLSIAKGDYICFIDSDDSVDPNYLQELYHALIETNSNLAICGYQRINESSEIVQAERCESEKLDENELWEEIFGHLNNAVWNKLYRKDILKDLQFPEGLYHGEDLMFNLQYISRCNGAVQIKSKLYHYWEREGSITKSGFSERKIMEIDSKDSAREFVKNHNPNFLSVADKYCFRARMNVIRNIYKNFKENNYSKQVCEFSRYVKEHYPKVSSHIKFKEKIEYFLFVNVRWLYRRITR